MTPTRVVLTGAALLLLAACGGSDAPADGGQAAAAADTSIKPMVREPLTEADMAGLSMANLSVELPWTINKVSHDPAPAAPRASVTDAQVSETDGFDRVTFTFADGTPFPGYSIQMVDSTATYPCKGADQSLDLGQGQRAMLVRIAPARASNRGEVWVPVRTRRVGLTRFASAGVVCDDGGEVIWVASVSSGDEVRVLEMRAPNRLVADLR